MPAWATERAAQDGGAASAADLDAQVDWQAQTLRDDEGGGAARGSDRAAALG